MKVLNKAIEVLAHCDEKGNIRPLRIKLNTEDGSDLTIKFKKLYSKEVVKFMGKHVMKMTGTVELRNAEKICELHYYFEDMKWFLFKI